MGTTVVPHGIFNDYMNCTTFTPKEPQSGPSRFIHHWKSGRRHSSAAKEPMSEVKKKYIWKLERSASKDLNLGGQSPVIKPEFCSLIKIKYIVINLLRKLHLKKCYLEKSKSKLSIKTCQTPVSDSLTFQLNTTLPLCTCVKGRSCFIFRLLFCQSPVGRVW